MTAEPPTREQVAAVRVAAQFAFSDGRMLAVRDIASTELAICDLADAYLAAPLVELTPSQRAVWGRCPLCGVGHGERCRAHDAKDCVYRDGVYWIDGTHPARLEAAPTHCRMVAVKL